MTVTFNHTIIAARDRDESARFFRELSATTEIELSLPAGFIGQTSGWGSGGAGNRVGGRR